MNLEYSPTDLEFRDEVRRFIQDSVPSELKAKVLAHKTLSKADMELYHSKLNEKGWLAQSWPEEYGGCAWTAVQKHIFDEETAAAGCPRIVPFGVSMLGPVLLKFGDEAQKRHFLPRILDGSDWWCQGYSEPGAGSDLASLKPALCVKVTSTSLMVRKPGRHSASLQTGYFVWCARQPRANHNRAFHFYSSI